MAGNRIDEPFIPIDSSHTSFLITLSTVSTANAFESSGRAWGGGIGRTIRLAESSGNEYFICFGTTTAVADPATCMLCLGGVVEVFKILPADTHIAIFTNSTSPSNVCITLGYGR